MTDDALIARLRAIDYTAPHDDLCHEAAARIAALELRISGYQASRDYAIDLLAKALGIEPDKMRAVEYYAREAAERIAALTAEAEARNRMQDSRMAVAQTMREKAEAERDALRKDAERYRGIRDASMLTNAEYDSAVDSAIIAAAKHKWLSP